MRRLWLLLAFVVLVFVDLSVVPVAVLAIFAGSDVASSNHSGPVLTWALLVVVLAAALMALTVLVGRAWRRAPRPS
jgi:hypothetical protein